MILSDQITSLSRREKQTKFIIHLIDETKSNEKSTTILYKWVVDFVPIHLFQYEFKHMYICIHTCL